MKDITCNIKSQMSSFLKEIETYPCYSKIEAQMEKAKNQIGYPFENMSFLKLAFCREKLENEKAGSNNKTYKNDTLAQIGDSVLDLVIAECGFSEGKGKKDIDDERQSNANNKLLSNIVTSKDLRQFCYHKNHFYNDAPKDGQVSSGNHDSIVEAIIGAIYLDGGFDKARKWIIENVLNL